MELTTERLMLREFEPGDWPAVLAYQNDPRYLRYYDWTERTPAAVQAFVAMFLGDRQVQPRLRFQLAVVLASSREVIGNCGIRRKTAAAHEGDIGFELAPAQWGHGYATEAARAIVDFGFTELKLHRIWAWCIAENTASVNVLQKLGMQPEGRLRANEYFKGRWWDTRLFGLLNHEWRTWE